MTTTATAATITPLSRPVVYGGLTLAIAAVSTSAVLTAFVLGDPPVLKLAFAIAFWRCAGATVVLGPVAWTRRRQHPVSTADRRLLMFSGAFLAVHFLLFLGSLAYTTVASSTTFATMSPLFVAFGGIRFLGERPTRRVWIGMGITMLGALVIAAADLRDVSLGPVALFGDALALLSAVAVTGYLLIGRRTRARVHLATYGSVVYGTAAVLLLVFCIATGTPLWGFTTAQTLGIIGIVVGPQLLGHTVFNTLLSTVPPTVVSVAVLAEPLVATLLAWVFLGQLPAAIFWVGAPIVLAGVARATTGAHRAAPVPPM